LVEKDLNKTEDAKKDYDRSVEIHASDNKLSDSAKVEEEAKLLKFTSLTESSESQKDSKTKIQYANVDIQPQSIFYVNIFPEQKKVHLYKLPPQKNIKDSLITLTNVPPDSIDDKSILRQIAVLDSAIKKDSSNASYYYNRAILYSVMQKYNLSIADYNKSLRLDSTNAITWFGRANTRYKLLELLYSFDAETSIVNEDNPKNYLKRVYVGQTYEMVLSDYSKALTLDPDFTYAWFNKATTKIKMDDYLGAVNDYSIALSCDPTLSDIYYNRGLLYIILHKSADACLDLSKAGELGINASYNVMKRFCYK
ncbi:MAG: tetratricopeptide repeat protein, partial [Bacteroidia bacterium]